MNAELASLLGSRFKSLEDFRRENEARKHAKH